MRFQLQQKCIYEARKWVINTSNRMVCSRVLNSILYSAHIEHLVMRIHKTVSSFLHSNASPAPLWLCWLSIMAATFSSRRHTCSRYFFRICRYELKALLKGKTQFVILASAADIQDDDVRIYICMSVTCEPVWAELSAPRCPCCGRCCLRERCWASPAPKQASSSELVLC